MSALVLALSSISASAPTGGGDRHAPAKLRMHSLHPSKGEYVTRRGEAEVASLRHSVVIRRTKTWEHQDAIDRPRTKTAYAERRTRSVPFLGWIRSLWAGRAHKAWQLRVELERRTLPDIRYVAGANSWLRAVDAVQVAYPGTAGWLRSCSAGEGGWGRWVPNSQGSGVGGWLQMFPSTFWRMFGAAKADVESRGYIVPASAASWYSPLGQALGGAWGVTHGRRHEWMGAGC